MRLDSMVRFRIPKVIRARLARIAKEKFKTMPEVCREALRDYAETHEIQTETKSNQEAA